MKRIVLTITALALALTLAACDQPITDVMIKAIQDQSEQMGALKLQHQILLQQAQQLQDQLQKMQQLDQARKMTAPKATETPKGN